MNDLIKAIQETIDEHKDEITIEEIIGALHTIQIIAETAYKSKLLNEAGL